MESRMTMVQALDERDLLIKRIMSRTQKAHFVDLIRQKAAITWEKRMTRAEFTAEAQAALQQIEDLIARYDKLNAAIATANAATFLETSVGQMTVSCAIALRSRLRGSGPYGELTDFEGRLARRMEECYGAGQELLRRKNDAARREAAHKKKGAGNRIVVLQNSGNAGPGQSNPETAGDRAGNGTEYRHSEKNPDLMRIFDPLDIRKKAEMLTESKETLLAELETKIKISNAVTFIEV